MRQRVFHLQIEFRIAHSSAEPITDDERLQRIQQTVVSLNKIKSFAAEKKVIVAVETLPRSCVGNTADELVEIISQVNSPYVGICLDVNHMMDQYATLPDVVRQFGDNLITLHLSDYDGIDENIGSLEKG
jgi:sugar phosphate isomerase/epimerase